MIAGLPYDAEVEYLESTGTQWIDTGVYGNQSSGAEVMVSWPEISPDQPAFSADNGSISNGGFAVFMSRTLLRYGRNYAGIFKNGIFQLSANVFYDIVNKPSVVSVDGDSIVPDPSGNFSTEGTVPMFAWRRNANIIIKGKARIAFMKMWSGDTLVRDYIPVRFTNEQGVSEGAMYDRVSGALFRNAGTGSFTIGPDVATPVMGLHFMKQIPKYTAKSYVQDWLMAMWDGIENAGWLTHDPNATTWKDLTGNGYDIAIPSSGAVWGDDKISLAATSFSTDLPQVNRTEFTIECVATGTSDGSYVWMKNPSWIGGAIIGFGVSFGLWYPWAPLGGGLGVPTWSAKNSIALTWKQSEQAGYLNGQEMLTSTGSIDSRNVLSKIYMGEYNGSICTTLDGYHFRLYSRALTADEIAHNYAVDKERFNLP